ncbi:class I SAM-dependent methyltransferase [Luteimonas salinilitoris]|uniref:Class I SAM-dependent methyltransferase n=1 Tax=Luteimonas salinilitoris TaxID=3237697 RepID=A0ABV4HUT9_9GAMM
MNPFSDPQAVARYTEGAPRNVPGYHAMQRMTTLLLAERVREDARVLVLGAGGGLELKTFAETRPDWSFDGVDPSAEMLKLAQRTLGPFASRATLHQGYISDAPIGPFDAATCLLTLHFLTLEERQRTTAEVHRRLKPGAPFVVTHFCIPQDERPVWLSRFAAYAAIDPDQAAAIDSHLTILSPEQDEAILREAGFSNVSLFYAGFTFRGWVGYA